MSRNLDTALQQSRHRVLCGILSMTEEGMDLIDRARRLGFPVDWHDQRVYPSRPGYSDYGVTFMLAKDVAKAEAARLHRLTNEPLDYPTLDALAAQRAQFEATSIFNSLRDKEIMLSGYANGRYFTCQQAMPWTPPRHDPVPAPAPRYRVRH